MNERRRAHSSVQVICCQQLRLTDSQSGRTLAGVKQASAKDATRTMPALAKVQPPEPLDVPEILEGVPEGQRDNELLGLACKLRYVDIPKDIAERLVCEAASKCQPSFPRDKALATVENAYERAPDQAFGGSGGSQPVRFEVFHELPPLRSEAPTLPPDLLPEALRPWLVDISERMQVSLEFVTVPALVSLAAVVGRRIGIHPKAHDDWLVVPNLWGGIVARPGKMKSPTIAECLKPVRQLAADARETYERKQTEQGAKVDSLKAKEAALKDLLKQAHKGTKKEARSPEELEEELTSARREMRELKGSLAERRYVVNDTTVEKLGELLARNPGGMLLERDELAGWLRALDREDRKGDREFYLEAWNGTGSYIYDRIGRGTIHIPALCLSVIGGIQPTKLAVYVEEALAGGYAADGLLQRFQLLVWPEEGSEWELVDRVPDKEARRRAFEVFSALSQLEVPRSLDGGDIPAVRFVAEAQELFNEWLTKLEKQLRSPELVAQPAFESHLAKYRSLMPSLALLFHLVDTVGSGVGSAVSLQAARLAASWCEFLESHVRNKVYAAERQPGLSPARALATKIRNGAVTDSLTPRDVYHKGWRGLKNHGDVAAAIQVLERNGWIRLQTLKTGGRPSDVIRINPAVMEKRE